MTIDAVAHGRKSVRLPTVVKPDSTDRERVPQDVLRPGEIDDLDAAASDIDDQGRKPLGESEKGSRQERGLLEAGEDPQLEVELISQAQLEASGVLRIPHGAGGDRERRDTVAANGVDDLASRARRHVAGPIDVVAEVVRVLHGVDVPGVQAVELEAVRADFDNAFGTVRHLG